MVARREFVRRSALGLGGGLLAAAGMAEAQGGPPRGSAKVPMPVPREPSMLSWVSSVTGCLRALGSDCDLAEVAGMTGYAFVLNIWAGNLVSGPTGFDTGLLLPGLRRLGRSTLAFKGEWHAETPPSDVREQFRTAYDLVAAEVAAGRPCVIWGTYLPEYGIAYGVEDGSYLVSSYRGWAKEAEPPIAYDALTAPSGAYALAFPCRVPPVDAADRFALGRAVMLSRRAENPFQAGAEIARYSFGLAAYDAWIECLEGDTADGFGHAFCAHSFGDARRMAAGFVRRVADRNAAPRKVLTTAADAYVGVARAFDELRGLFPFPPGEEIKVAGNREAAVRMLKAARAAEQEAVAALEEALALRWA